MSEFKLTIDSSKLQKALLKKIKDVNKNSANAVNRAITSIRRDIAEELIGKTGLKRKLLNDRMSLKRARQGDITGRITAIFGPKRLLLGDYPYDIRQVRSKTRIQMLGPRYRKRLRTGFEIPGKGIFLRKDSKLVRAFGRSVPGLFLDYQITSRYRPKLLETFKKELKAGS
jgi:hypothetical protein